MLTRRALLAAAGSLPAVAASATPIRFHTGPEWDKPFLYPLTTVSGVNIARRHPMEKLAGENTDHAWHRGIFYGHGRINGHDFWRELGREKTSRLVAARPPRTGGGRFAGAFRMVTEKDEDLGEVTQRYAVRDRGALRFIDAEIGVQSTVALTFGDTDDGGFAFRLTEAFREDRGARLRNSEGLEGTKNIWGKAARWVDYAAVIDGTPAGIAIFDHPGNLRHPTQWHARGYGLCSANPFAAHSFNKSAADGSYMLPAGRRLTLRYRVVIHEGQLEPPAIEALYRSWR